MPASTPLRARDRLAAGFLLLLLAAGSLILWLGIPVAGLWLLSKLTDSWNGHFLLSVVLIPLAMAFFAPILFWLNGLYLRVIGVLRPGDDEDRRWRLSGPLELFLYAGMLIALVALFAWFFFLAKNPPEIVW
jgi:MFS family permease